MLASDNTSFGSTKGVLDGITLGVAVGEGEAVADGVIVGDGVAVDGLDIGVGVAKTASGVHPTKKNVKMKNKFPSLIFAPKPCR